MTSATVLFLCVIIEFARAELLMYFPLDGNSTATSSLPVQPVLVQSETGTQNGPSTFGDTINGTAAFAGSHYNDSTNASLRRCLTSSGGYVDPGDEFSLTAWIKMDSKREAFGSQTVCGGGLKDYSCRFHV